MNKYWLGREQELLYNRAVKQADKELLTQYTRCFKMIKQYLSDLYDEIQSASADGTLLASDLYRFNRYYDLLNSLNQNLTILGQKELDIGESKLTNLYNANAKVIDTTLGSVMPIDERAVKTAIDAIWCPDGKHWSSRIWSNKSMLEERVKNGIVNSIATGASKDKLIKQLKADFGVGYSQASRIARTELSFVQNRCALDRYEQAGIEKYQILSNQADDSCLGENGKEFYLRDAQVGVNFPPFHPNCRCTVLAVI